MGKLDIRELSVYYGRLQAVREVTFEVNADSCVAFVGRNGAGKTSLLRAIAGLVPFVGTVSLDGETMQGRPDQIARRGIVHVLEGRHVFASMTVMDNLLVARAARGRNGFAKDLDWVFEIFPVLATRRTATAGALSGGQAQMLAIGRALLANPKILLLDEPSLGLAPVAVDQLADSLALLRKERSTALVVSDQSATLAAELADTVYMFDHGQIVGKVAESEDIVDALARSYFAGDKRPT